MRNKFLMTLMVVVCVCSLGACAGKQTDADGTEVSRVEQSVSSEEEESSEASTSSEEESNEASTSSEAVESSEASVEVPAVNTPAELSEDLYSFQVAVDGTVYQFPMWYSDFEALGWTYKGEPTDTLSSNQYTAAETWTKGDNMKVYTKIANLSINAQPFSKCMVAGITFDKYDLKNAECEIVLPKGIKYGVSTRDDVIAAYGTPTREYEGSSYYKLTYSGDTYSEFNIYVYLESGVVEKIEIENIVELEGADNSVKDEVPAYLSNYVAPTELGNDLYKVVTEYEGKLYSMPCPVTELLNNGFTVKEEPEAISAGGFARIEFMYNNQSFRTTVRNYADYATGYKNCMVTELIARSNSEPKLNMVLPCGIKLGDTEDELKQKIGDFHYEEKNGEYVIYDPVNGNKLDAFQVSVYDGVVVGLEASNSKKPE